MGVQHLAWNYDQMGVVATLYLAEEGTNSTAWQRLLPTGPVALLPLDSKRSSLVWSTWKDNAKELLQLPEEQFIDALNDALVIFKGANSTAWQRLLPTGTVALLPLGSRRCLLLPPSVRAIVPASRAAFPLGFGHSTKYIAPGVALIGDAAHRVHPLAGQGVNLGFGDVNHLTEMSPLLDEEVRDSATTAQCAHAGGYRGAPPPVHRGLAARGPRQEPGAAAHERAHTHQVLPEDSCDSTNIKRISNVTKPAGTSADAIIDEGQSSSTVTKTKQKTRKKVMGSQ
ncbi:Ubiquinone biosynthesis monooxygenase COQ6, partial [Operophtera brumata]